MNRALRAAPLLLVCLGLSPAALAAETPQNNVAYVFQTVDSFLISQVNTVEVTGILQGESAPRTFSFESWAYVNWSDISQYYARCDRMALLAMSKPGAYLFEMKLSDPNFMVPTCRLTRRQVP